MLTDNREMRLTQQQLALVRSTVFETVNAGASIWLFGSRLDDTRRGGDVDLLVQSTPLLGLLQRARLKNRLEQQLGLPVEIVAAADGDATSPFVRLALAQGVQL